MTKRYSFVFETRGTWGIHWGRTAQTTDGFPHDVEPTADALARHVLGKALLAMNVGRSYKLDAHDLLIVGYGGAPER